MSENTPEAPPRDFFDFDAWALEHTAAPIRYKLLGKTWDLPGDVPAATMLKLYRFEEIATTGKIPDGFEDELANMSTYSVLSELVGQELVDQWLAEGLQHRMMQAVTGRLYRVYSSGATGADEAEDGEGKGEGQETPTEETTPE